MATKTWYFVNAVSLKAEIDELYNVVTGTHLFRVTRYSYPDKIMHSQIVGEAIFANTFDDAKAQLDMFYDNKGDLFKMREVDKQTFQRSFEESNEEINLNRIGISITNCRFGTTADIVIRVGKKRFYMDISRNSAGASIDVYDFVSKDRRSFSKYDANLHTVAVGSPAYIYRKFVEHIEEIEQAQMVLRRFPLAKCL